MLTFAASGDTLTAVNPDQKEWGSAGLVLTRDLAGGLIGGAWHLTKAVHGNDAPVVPHALRRLCGPDHRLLVPLSLVLGGAALVTCDLLARLAFRWLHTEPPVGAVTALIGGPVFLALLRRSSRAG